MLYGKKKSERADGKYDCTASNNSTVEGRQERGSERNLFLKWGKGGMWILGSRNEKSKNSQKDWGMNIFPMQKMA